MGMRKIISIFLFVSSIVICVGCASNNSLADNNVEKSKSSSITCYNSCTIANDAKQETIAIQVIQNNEEITSQSFETTQQTNETQCATETAKAKETNEAQYVTETAEAKKTNEVQYTTETAEVKETNEEQYATEIVTEEQEIIETQSITEVEEIKDIRDGLIIKNDVIDIFYGPADQKNVDENDVVQNTTYWTNSRSIFLFGHNTGSFCWLKYVEVGETISLINDGVKKTYIVTRSEKGVLTEDGTDISISSDGALFVHDDFGYEDIRLVTCLDAFSSKNRWIVIAQLIE